MIKLDKSRVYRPSEIYLMLFIELFHNIKKSRFWSLFFLVLLLIADFFAVRALVYNGHIINPSNTWPSTTGKILSSSICKEIEYVTSGNRPTVYYIPKITYSYNVGSVKYTNDTISYMMPVFVNDKIEPAASIVKSYPVGKVVKVYYNPSNPHNAVLSPSVANGILVLYIPVIIFLFVVTLVYIVKVYLT